MAAPPGARARHSGAGSAKVLVINHGQPRFRPDGGENSCSHASAEFRQTPLPTFFCFRACAPNSLLRIILNSHFCHSMKLLRLTLLSTLATAATGAALAQSAPSTVERLRSPI